MMNCTGCSRKLYSTLAKEKYPWMMAPMTNTKKMMARSRVILDKHHRVEFGAVLPGEFVLGPENAE